MKNIVEINNVKNVVTEDIGTLYMIASVDKEAYQLDDVKHQGLSIFFRPEGEIYARYVKSFVFTDREARLMRRGKINCIRDLGYFLDVENLTLDIMCLESGMNNTVSRDNMFGTQKITRVVFSLEYNDKGYTKLEKQALENRNHMCGFRYAVHTAFTSMINITDDTIVPSIFPGEGTVTEYNFVD